MEWQKKLQAGMKDLPKPDEPNVPEPESITNAKLSIVSFRLLIFVNFDFRGKTIIWAMQWKFCGLSQL